ncbi:Bifunctional protein FolD [Bienertia sinuspersici]
MSINRYLGFVVVLLLLNLASSSFISDVFESHRSTGRSLLQTQKNMIGFHYLKLSTPGKFFRSLDAYVFPIDGKLSYSH